MSENQHSADMMVVAPGLGSQGGIAVVVENYRKTPFWKEFGCTAFASTVDQGSRWGKLLNDVRRLGIFARILATSKKPRVVSIHTAHDTSFYRKFSYLAICRLFRVPAVLHIHPEGFVNFSQQGNFFRRFMIRISGNVAEQIVVLSESIRDSLRIVFPADKIHVLNNPVDLDTFTVEPAPPKSERPRILFLGWIIREKGVYDLANAIPSVLSKFPDALFTFAGNKEIVRLKQLLARLGLEKSSEVLGWVDGRDKINLLRTSWILALPSYAEGVPNVVLEAMASSLPIVTTPVGGLPDILKNEQTALFVEPGDVGAISDAILKLLTDREFSNALASAAFQRAVDFHGLEEVDRGLRRIYDRYRSNN
jgi:glycosyltransferase involved in cell wall biosynthesis